MYRFLKYLFYTFCFLVLSVNVIFAQARKKAAPVRPPKRGNTQPAQPLNNAAAPVTPTKPIGGNNQTKIPYVSITAASSAGTGINDTVKQSLRPDNIIDAQLVKDRTPLVYKFIREDDAVYKQRIWREIDAREKINLPFRYSLIENNGSQRFINILINAIKSGVTAFDPNDDRFTTPFTTEQALASLSAGKPDTIPVQDLDGNIVRYDIKSKPVELDSVYKYKIKEEVVFDKETSRLYTRILGIAPQMPKYSSDGSVFIGNFTLFWLYYPDLRPTLAKYQVYNPKNFGARMSWEDLFESRMFSSYITKATIDNPFDQTLTQKYGKNKLFILLEGDAIKDKIFNYEQDLWAY